MAHRNFVVFARSLARNTLVLLHWYSRDYAQKFVARGLWHLEILASLPDLSLAIPSYCFAHDRTNTFKISLRRRQCGLAVALRIFGLFPRLLVCNALVLLHSYYIKKARGFRFSEAPRLSFARGGRFLFMDAFYSKSGRSCRSSSAAASASGMREKSATREWGLLVGSSCFKGTR